MEKSHAVEAITNLKTLNKAKRLYYLQHGEDVLDLTKLDIEIPNSFYVYHCISSAHPQEGGDCYAKRADGKFPAFEMTHNALYCRGESRDCKPFSTTKGSDGYWIIEQNK